MSGARPDLSGRERQIMDIVYRWGRATVAQIQADLPDAPTASAIRTMLKRLEEKEQLEHEQDGPRNVYLPIVSRDRARDTALERLLRTFFDGSPTDAVAAILDRSVGAIPDDELDRLEALVESARKSGR
ncbi:MAG: BlaI/MecI/CopY family transcriptional regulator [Gemmatimonadota bacterium]